jgi:hypothetical protein
MKQYAIGLITGILLTASAVMFIGAKAVQDYDDYYDRKIYRKVRNIESKLNYLSVECNGGYVYCN